LKPACLDAPRLAVTFPNGLILFPARRREDGFRGRNVGKTETGTIIFVRLLKYFLLVQCAISMAVAQDFDNSLIQRRGEGLNDKTLLQFKPSEDERQSETSISKVVSSLLERSHFSRQAFDDAMSAKFLNRYIDTLDALHLHFLKSDIDEFEKKYRDSLDELTMKRGDASPCHEMFARLYQRAEQRANYAQELLRTEKFEFTGNDEYLINRKEAPRPVDMNAAKALWRQHLRYEYLQEKLNKQKPLEIQNTLSNRYTLMIKTLKDTSPDEVLEIYLTALAHVYDPHSDYMGHNQLENFSIGMKLSLFGIGALLGTKDGYCHIEQLMPGGPAELSKKLKPKDKIIAVAQGPGEPVDVVGWKLSKIVELIRGPKGTEVKLTVIPVGAPDPSTRKIITLVRDEIQLVNSEAKAKIIDVPSSSGGQHRLGVIDLPSFYADFGLDGRREKNHKSTTTDVAKLLNKLNEEKVDGIILDLRRNGGGSLEEAINLTGLFIKKGPVVQTKDPTGEIVVDSDTDPTMLYSGPLIVLTSRFSASASEILAGALQDYGRAVIVGDSSTHGKGTVQSLIQLKSIMEMAKLNTGSTDPGALKLTVRKFYRAGGSSTQLKGVIPDIILPSANNYAEIGESALENPLPWDEVPTAKLDKFNLVKPYIDGLQKRSSSRIADSKDYSYVREDIERFRKALQEKSVSLNEAKRLQEKKEIEESAAARKKERLARKESEQKVYEITLKNAETPGLPAPVQPTNTVASATVVDPLTDHASDDDEDGGLADETKGPSLDVTLEETKHILSDYIGLWRESKAGETVAKTE
jgi:carboxyl-terminal processing protease